LIDARKLQNLSGFLQTGLGEHICLGDRSAAPAPTKVGNIYTGGFAPRSDCREWSHRPAHRTTRPPAVL